MNEKQKKTNRKNEKIECYYFNLRSANGLDVLLMQIKWYCIYFCMCVDFLMVFE